MITLNKPCIYCRQIKAHPKEFNAEHVIPELFGTFGTDTMTLNDLVCRKCNQYFGDNLELYLGRDSVFGLLYRSISGIMQPAKFKKSIRHKRQRVEFSINPIEHDHLLVDLELNDNLKLSAAVANQIAIMNSTKGNRLHFRPNQLPHISRLKNIGLKPTEQYITFFSRGHDTSTQIDEFNCALKNAQINILLGEDQFIQRTIPLKEEPLYFKSIIDENIQRALAKIVFNYFAHQYPRLTVLSNHFNEITNFIRYGLKSHRHLINIDNKPIITNLNKIKEKQYSNHIISVYQDKNNNITSQMSLFNSIRFEVILSRSYPLINFLIKGSFFDLSRKRIIDITDSFRHSF